MMKKLIAAALMTAVAGISVAAGVRVQTVEAQGVGTNREDAVKAALAEAVARVAGLSLDAHDAARMESESTIKSTEKADIITTKSQEKVRQEVQTATRGTVRSYQVISVDRDPDTKLLRAKLSVDVNYFQPGQETERMRIAVLPFKVLQVNENDRELGKLLIKLNQSMVSYLTGSRHFAVLDRDYLGDRLGELKSLMREDVRLEERARLGNSLATDYIVTGVVTDFKYSSGLKKIPFTNEVRNVSTGDVSIQWRVIEASTGQIMVSDTLTRTVNTSGSISDGGISLGEKIGETITNQIYPLAAITFENNQFVLAQGGVTLHVGDVYQLVRQGPIRHDPYTKEQIGRDEIPVGEVRISRVSPKISYAEIITISEDPKGMAPREYLLRPLENSVKTVNGRPVAKPARTQQPQW